ncbi:MAG: tRNA threonylcarbamoyladenosine dehydratase [Lachnospiraceae bacterium]|nr:tRNA threonylcarbamoyladenosine dehydratase [Lachnospiraceae bacterium]
MEEHFKEEITDKKLANAATEDQFERTRRVIGKPAIDKLNKARVAVFGIGGVGGYVCEALVRSGIEHIDLIDSDKVVLSNINRQIIATHSTIGQDKVDVMTKRLHDINPNTDVKVYKMFFLPENADLFPWEEYDYVVDAIDTVTAKIELVKRCDINGTPIISSMGTAGKLNPTMLQVSDIYKTKVCPLAKVMRKELRDRGIKSLKVVYSEEQPIHNQEDTADINGKHVPGSVAFVPSVAGLIIAGEVVKDIIAIERK